ncbi:hypothetical protein CSUI_006034 [Cystoisospora suis]|uniref:Uncharacterized protein n=1 Tax=Cystoisospora suis TaxID=483139 RepID=A0A2C6KT57_9APIC|nr:hypothetical protein CSUI_006034 [Cystoisospora suis]
MTPRPSVKPLCEIRVKQQKTEGGRKSLIKLNADSSFPSPRPPLLPTRRYHDLCLRLESERRSVRSARVRVDVDTYMESYNF